MGKHILITGGAGFICSRLADEPLQRSYRARALYNHVMRAGVELEEKGETL